ncbi:MAG: hypothetical protein Kow00109_18570 [Acidobacteriota bacterium]
MRSGWEIRRGGGEFRSGLLVCRGRRIVYLNREAGEVELRKVLAEALLTGDWESVYLSPALRRWLEEEIVERQTAARSRV